MPADYLEIHPDNPQPRLVAQVVERVARGAIIAYPTDSSYALGCHIGDKDAMDRIRAIREFGRNHLFTLMCSEMSEVANFARVDNWAFRILKHATPGPYTFLLSASKQVPRRLQSGRRKTIGVRVPDNAIVQEMLRQLGEPMVSCTLMLPGRDLPFSEADEIVEELGHRVDLIVDGGPCGYEPTTVVDLTSGEAQLVREGRGALDLVGL